MAEIFVLVDHANGAVRKTTAEMLTIAARLGEPAAVFLGAGAKEAQATLAKFGATKVYAMDSADLTDYLVAPQAEFLAALVSKLNKSGQEAVAKYVAASGKKTVNVEELRQGVAKYGVYWLKIPTNFVGRVDARNTLYTVNGRALGVQPTGIATMNKDWHPDSDDTYVFSVF